MNIELWIVQLLKLLSVVNWTWVRLLLEEDVLARAISQVFERFEENYNCKCNGISLLLKHWNLSMERKE